MDMDDECNMLLNGNKMATDVVPSDKSLEHFQPEKPSAPVGATANAASLAKASPACSKGTPAVSRKEFNELEKSVSGIANNLDKLVGHLTSQMSDDSESENESDLSRQHVQKVWEALVQTKI